MSHSNGHAGHPAPNGHSSPVLSWNGPAEHSEDPVQPQEQDGQEVRREANGGSLPREWNQVSRLALKHLDRCVSLQPKVLQGDDPDAIHDLRVATRRLQQVLDLLYPPPHSGEIRKLCRGLKRCRRSLSEVRNYDVLLERVDAALARKRTARREAWETIRDYLKDSRSARLEKALRKLARANLSAIYVRLKDCLAAHGHSRPETERADHSGAGQNLSVEEFHSRISGGLRKVWENLEQEIARSRHEPDPAALHRARIAAKRARYLIEVLHSFDVQGSKEALIWLRSLQKHLGRWHDLVVFEETVIGMIADPAFLRDHLEMALAIERLILQNRAMKTKLEKKFLEMTADRMGFFKIKGWVRRVAASPAPLLAAQG